jgi:protein involved in polysaccharide export with SLBB domain
MGVRSFLIAAALIGFATCAVDSAFAGPSDNSPSVASVSSGVSGKQTAATTGAATPSTDESYVLGGGDKIRLSVFGETDLGGEFEIDGSGVVRLPLIGQVKAAGMTVHQFEDKLISMFEDGYLKDPRVSVEVINYRPFYIIGEVNKPGQYPYVSDMNALNAVALAGGYTAKADKSEIYIQRTGVNGEKDYPSNETTKIRPGDVVRIPERFF